ncbi:site-specific integrase [Polaribacter vadi]|uniref:site-specific integrase n=1 Tax=Polaribacter TaxID=52959 RepID=UPI001C094913|nr:MULTISPECIES: site-specific integrase [Polaribacter]MBU3011386.1 site-specific integrase [Polaribacter vadi]MDO6741198.1 site-specific integrase [Polaribacter sp. 1_MG-2023]
MKNVNTLIYLKSRKNKKGESPIYLRITVNGRRKEKSLGKSISSKRWNTVKQRGKGNTEDIRELNKFLISVEHSVFMASQELINNKIQVNIETLMNKYLNVEEKGHMLIESIENWNLRKKALVKNSTYKKYITSFKHVKKYLMQQYGLSDIDIKRVDNQFVSDYDYHLRTKMNIDNNTAIRYVKTLAAIFKTFVENGWLDSNPFSSYKKTKVIKDVVSLTQQEIDVIYKKDFGNKSLERVRDIFIFCCYTGLAYCDVQRLSDTHIVQGMDGYRWIRIKRQKTNVLCDIPLFPIAEEIIKKYENDNSVVVSGRLLPTLTNQKMNAYLKTIGDLCGIHKKIHFHMARHTFGTTILAANRSPIETSMRIMGHKTTSQTRHYAKISKVMVEEDVADLRKKLKKRNQSSDQGNMNKAI